MKHLQPQSLLFKHYLHIFPDMLQVAVHNLSCLQKAQNCPFEIERYLHRRRYCGALENSSWIRCMKKTREGKITVELLMPKGEERMKLILCSYMGAT
jgi:hypothetical protein